MASGPITSWQIDGETMETVSDFIFLGSKITADGNCSHERKAMTNLDRILKSRDYFAYKGPYSQSYGFSCGHVWMWDLQYKESWAPKNWCLWTVVLEKTLESPLNTKEIKLVSPKGINHEYLLEGLKLKLQYFGYLIRRADSLEKTLIPGKTESRRRRGDRGWDGWVASLTQWTWVWVKDREAWPAANCGVTKSQTWLRD